MTAPPRPAPRIAQAIVLAAVIAACGPGAATPADGEPAALHIVNVDGPDVVVLLGEAQVATVACGSAATLEPGGALNQLPWNLTVRAVDGVALRTVTIDGPLPSGILIRGRTVLTGPWPMSYGPAPSPLGAPCGSDVPS